MSHADLPPTLRPCDVAALKRCLEETGGDKEKCAAEIAAFQRACAAATPTAVVAAPTEPTKKQQACDADCGKTV